jgi:3-hydroxyisobutyrate dehydrogenase-like beta-hydroxyacid dehydrogenase
MKVGFIGLGNMGNPMAANVLAAGYDMTVYDIRREKGENLEAGGATWGSSPKEVAGRSDVVFTSLPGPAEVEAVVLSNDGIFAGLNEGAAYIDTTTNAPATMRNIAEIGASRGFQVLDAPISGGKFGARDGSLTVFVGGEKAVFDQFRLVLQSFGKNVVYMGPAGAGSVTKLVNNLLLHINFIGACEGLVMGAKFGIDPRALIEVITPSLGDSIVLRTHVGRALRGEKIDSATDLAVKDMRLAVELGKELDVPLEVGLLVKDMITRFRDGGRGQDDITEIVGEFFQRSGVAFGEA